MVPVPITQAQCGTGGRENCKIFDAVGRAGFGPQRRSNQYRIAIVPPTPTRNSNDLGMCDPAAMGDLTVGMLSDCSARKC